MRTFTTDNRFNITNDNRRAVFLFEEIERHASGSEIQVQHKNEDGLWGGQGDDRMFTFHGKTISAQRVVNEFKEILWDEQQREEWAQFEAEHTA